MSTLRGVVAIALAAAACSAPAGQPQQVANARSPLASAPVCPVAAEHAWWLHELFPGCSPAPFWLDGVTCTKDCPRPCRGRFTSDIEPRQAAAMYEYDATGRLSITRAGWDARRTEARDEVAQHVACANGTCNVGDRPLRVRFDDAGRIVEMEHSALEYVDNRLVTERDRRRRDETTYAYHYDQRGRLARVTGSNSESDYERVYTYDNDLVVKWEEKRSVADMPIAKQRSTSSSTLTIEYDAQRRPVRFLFVELDHPTVAPRRTEQRYFYDCPEVSFDGANAEMARFKDRACACNAATCTKQVATELGDWQLGLGSPIAYANPDTKQAATYGALVRDTAACLERVFK